MNQNLHPLTKLVWVTPLAEQLITMMARVSNPSNQDNNLTAPRLIRYLIDHDHWSPFEMASMCIEINTTRAISPQLLRHRSFTFQEFSQRYANTQQLGGAEMPELRTQDLKNRQNSIDNLSDWQRACYEDKIANIFSMAEDLYSQMISDGVAKECARAILPLATPTRLYMCGTLRSWIHYIQLRTGNGTQKEHKDIAEGCKTIFIEKLPTIAEVAFKK